MNNESENIRRAENIWRMRDNGLNFQAGIGLRDEIRKNCRMYEGDQWEKPTKNTIAMPRPVIDITSFTVNNKLARIASSPVEFNFSSDETDTESLNDFWLYWRKKERFNKKFKKVLKKAAIQCGALMFLSFYGGDVHLEVVNPTDVFVANPRSEESIQEQDWVIIQQRLTVARVKKIAEKGVNLALITPDSETEDLETEQQGTEMCTLLHRFFRLNGEVYYERAVRQTMITSARPITPSVKAVKETALYKRIAKEIDDAYGITPVKANEDGVKKENPKEEDDTAKAYYYPFTYFSWEERENSFYGRSEVRNLISDQKAINVSYGIMLLGAQNEATGKTVARRGALGNSQRITNDPTQVLIDNSPSGNGYYKLSPTQISNASVVLVDNLVKYVRMTHGVSEVMTGEAYGANASGAAIAQLQSQASSSTDLIRDHIFEQLEEFGEVLIQMWRIYYRDAAKKEFVVKSTRDANGNLVPKTSEFNGEDYDNYMFDITVSTQRGTRSSVAGDIQLLEAAMNAGKLDFEDVIAAYPDSAIGDKKKMLAMIESRNKRESTMLAQKLQEVLGLLEQTQLRSDEKDKYIKKLLDVVKSDSELREKAVTIIKRDEEMKNRIVNEGAKNVRLEHSLEQEVVSNSKLKSALWDASSDVARLTNEQRLSAMVDSARANKPVDFPEEEVD